MNQLNKNYFFEGLHNSQAQAMSALLASLQENEKKISIIAPTRWGKDFLSWSFLEGLHKNGILPNVLISVPTGQLRDESFFDIGPAVAKTIFADGLADNVTTIRQALGSTRRVLVMTKHIVGMVQKTNPNFLSRFAAIIESEGHQDLSIQRQKDYASTNANLIALTATSAYSQTKSLKKAGYKQIFYMSPKEAVVGGYISPMRNVLVEVLGVDGSLDSLPLVGSDFDPEATDEFLLRAGLYQKATQLFIARAKVHAEGGFRPKVSMGFVGTIDAARKAAQTFNHSWQREVGSLGPYAVDAIWQGMPSNVERFFLDANMRYEIGPVAAPVWGKGMPDYARNYIVALHRSRKLPFISSVNIFIHGYTNPLVKDIYNLIPSLSGVQVGQRAGRAFGIDPENPEEEATIFDFILPATKRPALVYGQWAGGYLFKKSSAASSKTWSKEYTASLISETPDLNIISQEKEVIHYVRHSQLVAKTARYPHLNQYLPEIAMAMVQSDLTSPDAFYTAIRAKVRTAGMLDDPYWKEGTSRDEVFSTMRGETSPLNQHGYTPAAIIIASVLNKGTKALFGVAPQKAEWRDTTAITRRAQQDYLNALKAPIDHHMALESPEPLSIPLDHPDVEHGLSSLDAFKVPDPEQIVFEQQLKSTLTRYLLELLPKQERVIRARTGLNLASEGTLDQVAQTFHVTRERIRQIELAAFRTMRSLSNPKAKRRSVYEDEGQPSPPSRGLKPLESFMRDLS